MTRETEEWKPNVKILEWAVGKLSLIVIQRQKLLNEKLTRYGNKLDLEAKIINGRPEIALRVNRNGCKLYDENLF